MTCFGHAYGRQILTKWKENKQTKITATTKQVSKQV